MKLENVTRIFYVVSALRLVSWCTRILVTGQMLFSPKNEFGRLQWFLTIYEPLRKVESKNPNFHIFYKKLVYCRIETILLFRLSADGMNGCANYPQLWEVVAFSNIFWIWSFILDLNIILMALQKGKCNFHQYFCDGDFS